MAQFQRFTSDLIARRREPWVTLTKRGTISLNPAAYALLDNPVAVVLLYDEENAIVGLRASGGREPGARYVRSPKGKEAGPYLISAMAYIRFYAIPVDESRRWIAYLEDEVLCVDLREPGSPVSSNRAKSSQDAE
jgi:hypothetical protein